MYNNIIISRITDSVKNLKRLNKRDVNNPKIKILFKNTKNYPNSHASKKFLYE